MRYYSLIEGEGIAGPMHAVSATTTTLLSCLGIVFRNAATLHAGLYHYGANTLHDPFVQGTIMQMVNDLVPDRIYLTAPRATAARSGIGSTAADRDQLQFFFLDQGLADIELMPDQNAANYGIVGHNFTVNSGWLGSQTATRRAIEMATEMPCAQGRTINAHTTFYGGVGSRRPGRTHSVDDAALLAVRTITGKNVFG